MIIYEVNLTIDPDSAEEYATWLQPHIAHILEIDGFLDLLRPNLNSTVELRLTNFIRAESEDDHIRIKLQKTLEEIVDFIDYSEQVGGWSGGLSLSYNNANSENLSREELRCFTRISSEIYPQLEEHYDHVFDEWVAEEQEKEQAA